MGGTTRMQLSSGGLSPDTWEAMSNVVLPRAEVLEASSDRSQGQQSVEQPTVCRAQLRLQPSCGGSCLSPQAQFEARKAMVRAAQEVTSRATAAQIARKRKNRANKGSQGSSPGTT